MDRQLGLAPRGRVRHDADERARLEVEPRSRPQGAEDGLGGEVDELAHRGIVVRRPIRLLHVVVAQQLTADLAAPSVGLALGHGASLLNERRGLSLPEATGKSKPAHRTVWRRDREPALSGASACSRGWGVRVQRADRTAPLCRAADAWTPRSRLNDR